MKQFILSLITLYQHTSFFQNEVTKSLFLSEQGCRFHPTCSRYTYQAVDKYGVAKGLVIGIRRIIRCHPWSKGGIDQLQ